MTFDFTNYTYSGFLSLISALFSIAYPQIISSIERVDTRYNSTLLTSRFKKEISFRVFRILLICNLILAVLIPFVMYGSEMTHIYIIIQGIFTVCLIASTFCLFHTILHYGDPVELHQSIWNNYRSILDSDTQNKALEERSFSEWIDLSKTILSSSDQKAARKVYEGWTEYVAEFYKNHKLDNIDYDQYFYDGLTRLNETLCMMPTVPISVNNGNEIMTSLIMLDKSVTQTTYIMLWRNLRIQLFYGKDDWIMEYWTQASQKYELFMHKISEYEMNDDTGKRYTQQEVTKRDDDRWLFLRFHIMLCAMILKMGNYALLYRMLNFYQSKTPAPVYPLIPSDISSICFAFNQINIDSETNPFMFEKVFPMPGMNGISEGKIQGAAFEYLSLLVFRVYTLTLPWGAERAFQTITIPTNLKELSKLKESMTILLRWIKSTNNKTKLLEVVDISNWEETLEDAKTKYGQSVKAPEEIIDECFNEIDINAEETRQRQPYDETKVKEMKENVGGMVNKGLQQLINDFSKNKEYANEMSYWIDGSVYHLYPNAAFYAESDMSYEGIEESMSISMLSKFRHYFGCTFLRTPATVTYTIGSEDIFDCINRLNIGKDHVVIGFDIYWDYYLDKHPQLKRGKDDDFKYKDVSILNIKTGSEIVSQQFYVLNINEKPYLTFEKPSEDLKNKYYNQDTEKGNDIVWLSLQKIKDNPNLISESERNKMKDNPDDMSVFAAFLQAKCHWNTNVKMVKVNVKHKLIDNGNIDDVSIVKPFISNCENNKN